VNLQRIVFAAALLFGASTAARADIIIDDFSAPTPGINYLIGSPNPQTFVTNNISPGINRSVTLTVTSPTPALPNSMVGNIGDTGAGGFFTMSLSTFSSGNAVLNYNFTSTQNFTQAGLLGNLRYLSSADAGNVSPNVPLNFVINTASGNLTFNTTMNLTPTFTPTDVSLSNFTGTGDLTQVTGMSVTIVGGQAADVALDALSIHFSEQPPTLPAPPAALLALLALPALGFRHRLQKKEPAMA
jgi:hypothetical protein